MSEDEARELVIAISDLIDAKIHMINDQSAEGYSDYAEKQTLVEVLMKVTSARR